MGDTPLGRVQEGSGETWEWDLLKRENPKEKASLRKAGKGNEISDLLEKCSFSKQKYQRAVIALGEEPTFAKKKEKDTSSRKSTKMGWLKKRGADKKRFTRKKGNV